MKKMKTLSLIMLVGAVLLGGCSTDKGEKKSTNESSTNPKSQKTAVKWPYYEIRKEGEIKGYLLGTIHMGKAEMYPFPHKIVKDLSKSKNFITEVEQINMETPPDQEEAMNAMMTDTPITDEMSDETRKKYQAVLESYGVTDEEMAPFNRYGVYMMFQGQAMASAEDGTFDQAEASTYGVEKQLTIHHKQNKDQSNIGLETPEFQAEMAIKSFSVPEDIDKWVDSLLTKEETAKSSSNVGAIQNYIEGINDVSDVPKEQNDIINVSRNKTWSEKLPDYLEKDHQSFIAVGNAHLGGEEGLVSLLKKGGFELTRVTFD